MDRTLTRAMPALAALVAALVVSGCASWSQAGKAEGVPAAPAAQVKPLGVFGARVELPGEDPFILRVRLLAGGRAEMLTLTLGKDRSLVETGTWEHRFGRRVRVTLTSGGGLSAEAPLVLTFRVEADTLALSGTEPELSWTEGLRLDRNTQVEGPVWRLSAIRSPNGTRIVPQDPSRYGLVLSPDGTATVLADCNRGMGTYVLAGKAIVMRGLAFTRMICADDSLFDEYTLALKNASSCTRQGQRLLVFFDRDMGCLEFEPASD